MSSSTETGRAVDLRSERNRHGGSEVLVGWLRSAVALLGRRASAAKVGRSRPAG